MIKAEGFGLSAFAFRGVASKPNKNKAKRHVSEIFAVDTAIAAVASVIHTVVSVFAAVVCVFRAVA
ncbi:MAG TPA: hypothetical protein VK400_18575 [Pyrinomonadaceae bacterium]|nr:hypothetical protein [Pyrinomonadaceae bacterium]